MSAARGLCLDLDGTLADSLPALRRAYAQLVESSGRPASEGEFAALDGLPFGEVAERVRRTYAPAERKAAFAARYRAALEVEHVASPPAAGGRELLRAAAARGVPVAIVTSGPEALARRWLAAHGLAGQVASVIACEATAHGKPGPEPYLAALARIARRADETLAVEDSPHGAQAALTAGLETFVVCVPARREAFPAGCRFIASLAELCARFGDA